MATLQKIAALAVLALFVLSIVPLAIAHNDSDSDLDSSHEQNAEVGHDGADSEDAEVADDHEAAADESSNDSVPEQNERKGKNSDKIKDKVKELREEGKKLREKVAEAREKFEEAKAKYEEKKHEFQEKQKELRELNEKSKCNDESADCKGKKLDLKKGVKQHLVKTIELIDRSLEKLTDRVQSSKVLSEDSRAEALSSIASLEEQLTAKKEEILALGDNATNKELKDQIKELKSLWQDVRKEQKRIISDLINNKQESIAKVYTLFGERVEAQINKLAANGADVSSVQELLAQYKAKVQELSAVPAGERELFKQTAHDAKEILRKLLKEIKEIRKGAEKAAEVEDEEAADNDAEAPAADNGSEVPNVNEPSPEVEQPVADNGAEEPAAGESVVQ